MGCVPRSGRTCQPELGALVAAGPQSWSSLFHAMLLDGSCVPSVGVCGVPDSSPIPETPRWREERLFRLRQHREVGGAGQPLPTKVTHADAPRLLECGDTGYL